MLALRHLIAVRAPRIADLGRVQRVMTTLLRTRPDPLLQAIGALEVITPLLASISGALSPDRALRIAIPHLLTALTPDLPEAVPWHDGVTEVHGARLHRFEPPLRALAAGPSGVAVELVTGQHLTLDETESVETSLPLTRGALALVDTNPLAGVEAHPDKDGNALDLGEREPRVWVDALNEALGLIEVALPPLHAELTVTLTRVVPVGFEPERHLSASYREAPGLIYLTLHPDPLTLAEAIVHETQHGKLNLLSWLDPVLVNGQTEWSASPVRPDLRPLMGVLLAAHAFVPVAALHRALADAGHPLSTTPRFVRRRREVLENNAEALAVVQDRGEPTAVGARVLDALQTVHAETLAAAAQ
jgi:HEXXH motif-containing protein